MKRKASQVSRLLVVMMLFVSGALACSRGDSPTVSTIESAFAPAESDASPSPSESSASVDSTPTATTTPEVQQPTAAPPGSLESVADLVERVSDGVASIEVENCNFGAVGTGFVIDDHLVVTAAHVIEGAESISVTFGDDETEAQIVKVEPDLDLALLWIEEPVSVWHYSFADDVEIGEDVVVLGYPESLDFTVTQGSVTALDASDPYLTIPAIRIDAVAHPGTSGGPVMNRDGEVVGIAKAIRPDLVEVTYAIDGQAAKQAIDTWPTTPTQSPSTICKRHFDFGNAEVHARHREAEDVRELFDAYVRHLNTGGTDSAWRLLSTDFQNALGTEESFAQANETSTIFNFQVFSISDTPDGLIAKASFVSQQDPAFEPNGWDCTVWKMDYTLARDADDVLRIDGATHRPGSPSSCTDR